MDRGIEHPTDGMVKQPFPRTLRTALSFVAAQILADQEVLQAPQQLRSEARYRRLAGESVQVLEDEAGLVRVPRG